MNEIYDEILKVKDGTKDIKDVIEEMNGTAGIKNNIGNIDTYKSIVYINSMLVFYHAISEYEQLMKTTDEEKNVDNSLSEKSLKSIYESKMRV